jgi:hypothetical protein
MYIFDCPISSSIVQSVEEEKNTEINLLNIYSVLDDFDIDCFLASIENRRAFFNIMTFSIVNFSTLLINAGATIDVKS